MARIAFLLLCHKDPDAVIRQAERLTAAGDCMAIHFDRRSSGTDFDKIRKALDGNPNVVFAKRVKCGWGEWSLVRATLNAAQAALEAFPRATHFYMLSGDCMAIKTAEYAHERLDAEEVDYIESFDFFDSDWIRTGIKEERLIYRHLFNERGQKRLFYTSMKLQRALGLSRAVPKDMRIMIGSQWWCLRRRTLEAVMEFCKTRPDVLRFFRSTWIPDETFFQTLVRHLVPGNEIRSRTLTFLIFSDYGMPVTFYNDHYDMLLAQDFLFARKISPEARDLQDRLGTLYTQTGVRFDISNEGRRLHGFLTGRGREGRRFASRAWETEAGLGQGREALIILCKKWHVAKRLAARASEVTGIRTLDYLFDEDATDLPDLGGIGETLAKRTRNRRSVLRMLYERFDTERLIFCLDPQNFRFLEDMHRDGAGMRLLLVDCAMSDDYLAGHAQRIGLVGHATPQATLDRLLPTVRADVEHELNRILAAGLPGTSLLREGRTAEENARPLAEVLSISEEEAKTIATTDHLFSD
ncbi:MAG: glycosyl transferase [Rhodobacteraceae bacterium]|nr:glycosyl transferase [Paracoccaceae bacterium]